MDDLYITDMDGTLLNSNGQLSAPSYNYLKLLLSKVSLLQSLLVEPLSAFVPFLKI